MFCKKGVLKHLQNSQENTCVRVSFLIKLEAIGLRPATLFKNRLWHWCFPANFAKFLRTSFIIEHLWWLLLKILTIRAVQVFSAEPISTVVSFSRIFSIHQEHLFSGIRECLLFIFFTAMCQARIYSLYFFVFSKYQTPCTCFLQTGITSNSIIE